MQFQNNKKRYSFYNLYSIYRPRKITTAIRCLTSTKSTMVQKTQRSALVGHPAVMVVMSSTHQSGH